MNIWETSTRYFGKLCEKSLQSHKCNDIENNPINISFAISLLFETLMSIL